MVETQFIEFFSQYGWQLTLIAVAGIVILGILKYSNAFSKIEKENRKPVYLCISVGLSVGGSAVYLLVINEFSVGALVAIATAIYALNQTLYSVYENTKLRDLLETVAQKLIDFFNKK